MIMNDPSNVLQPVHDAQHIRDLGYRFADCCNRGDVQGFRSLWAEQAVWTIGAPMNITAVGLADIADTFVTLGSGWDFFVQMPHAPVVEIDRNRATSRWTVCEQATNSAKGQGYFNYARYEDVLLRTEEGRWLYLSRHYHYIYLDHAPLTADPLVATLRRGPGIH